MSKTLAFLVADADYPEKQMGAIVKVDRLSFDFDDLIEMMGEVPSRERCQDKFYSAGANTDVKYDITSVDGVCLFRFLYDGAIWEDWSNRAITAMETMHGIETVQKITPDALALILKNTKEPIGLGDIAGEWRGVAVLED